MKNIKKIKILIIIGQLDIGGTELHVLNITKNINREKYELALFPLRKGGTLEKQFFSGDIAITIKGNNYNGLGKIGLFISAVELIFVSFKYKPDIFHFFLPEAYIIGSIFTYIFKNSKRIMSRRSLNIYQKKHVKMNMMFLEKIFHKNMDFITGNSSAVCKQLMEEGVEKDKIKLIYNGVDLKTFKPKDSNRKYLQSKNINKSDLVIICIANLIPYKGHADLIRGIKLVDNQILANWHLLLVGRDDGFSSYLKTLVREQNLDKKIEFLGEVEIVSRLIEKSDIGILCSHQEGFSNSILECMAGGLPMIATNVGGNPEAVLNGVNGLIVDPYSPYEIGQAILKLANNELLRKEMGSSAREIVNMKFSLDKCVSEYEDLYVSTMLGN